MIIAFRGEAGDLAAVTMHFSTVESGAETGHRDQGPRPSGGTGTVDHLPRYKIPGLNRKEDERTQCLGNQNILT